MNKFIGAGTAVAAIMLANAPALAWEPNKSVEIVVAAGAGGASDQMARMMQAAIQKNKLMKSADRRLAQGRGVGCGSAHVYEIR